MSYAESTMIELPVGHDRRATLSTTALLLAESSMATSIFIIVRPHLVLPIRPDELEHQPWSHARHRRDVLAASKPCTAS